MASLPSTMPDGSKRVKVKASTNSSSGTPYCRPIEIAMAKLFINERKAEPSLCMSMKISASLPSSYSPLRQLAALGSLEDPLDDLLDDDRNALARRLLDELGNRLFVIVGAEHRSL